MPNFLVTFNCKGYGLVAMTVPAETAEKAVPLARAAARLALDLHTKFWALKLGVS